MDTRRRELRTAEGLVALRPKVFDLLAYLIDHRDRVISKQELFEQLWPDVHVGDATLNTCIKSARQAVGDSGKSQRVIRTWHGHGYRFVAAVEARPDDDLVPEAAALSATTAPAASPAAVTVERSDRWPAPPVPVDAFPTGKEHKQVTVLHCALPEAARFAVQLGDEAMYETMERVMAAAEETVERYGGTVTQWLGDGFVALFGAPRALEDHARRAVTASLDLLASLAKDRPDLPLKVGLHTGAVVVGTMAREFGRIYTAAGSTTDRARALQEKAPIAGVLASLETFKTVASEVDAAPFETSATDQDDAAPTYLIRGLVTRQSGVPRRSGPLTSRFLGRDRELSLLHEALELLEEGEGQVVSVSGEPGIGKSRLLEEFERGLAGTVVDSLRVNCLSYASASPYLPVRRLLRQICAVRSSDSPYQAFGKLDDCLVAAGLTAPLARSLLGELLGLPVDAPELDCLSPQERRTRTFDYLYTIVAAVCAARPQVIMVEDLHWIDATSEAWLSGLVIRLAGLRLLLLVTYRPGYQAPWLPQSSATQLALPGLKSHVSAALVRAIPTATRLSQEQTEQIVAKAQGNPFFLEELTWSFGSGRYRQLGIPETVQTVLADRIDRLTPSDKRLLQIAAVIGPEVSVPLLAAVDDLSDAVRDDGLLRLQEAELLYQRQAASERHFIFKHALTQDVAYLSLVARTRAAIHSRIARALEAAFQPLVQLRPELLAHHLTEAGEAWRATGYWLQAGRSAAERSANEEAVAQLSKGLELLTALPDGGERAERAIAFQLTLGVALQNAKGPGSTEAERVYQRVGELCRTTGDKRSLFFATFGLWRFHSAAFDLPVAADLAADLLDLAAESEDPILQLQARHAHWTTLYNRGELESARQHIERGLELWNPATQGNHAFMVAGHEPRVCAHLTISKILWLTGYPDRAAEACEQALSLADDLGHPPSRAIALNHALRLAQLRRDARDLSRWQNALRGLAAEHGFSGHTGWCDLIQLRLNARENATAERIAELRLTLASHPERAGAEKPFVLSVVADACRLAGRAADGLSVLAEAPESWSTPIWDAEFARLRGELLLALPADGPGTHRVDPEAEAEALFQGAITNARRQGARSLELRAATSLARLWNRQGKRLEARALLEPLYAWFTEGHGTQDLRDASDLLEG